MKNLIAIFLLAIFAVIVIVVTFPFNLIGGTIFGLGVKTLTKEGPQKGPTGPGNSS